ncbi:MAG TPA: outer membrane beta-barrel protein [Vicinamibacterales bacterium]|nr:outer membrane beta-barrel protein [Vicinamibacterales bacterium]
MQNTLVAACLVAVALLPGASASAQENDGSPDVHDVRVRIGPLMMNPTIALTNLGIDHNVFNDPPDKNPKQDFTFTVTPVSDFWLHLGPTWVTANLNESINWYQTYSTERTANNTYKLGWIVPGTLMNVKINGSYLSAKERPGFEIDTRVARKETHFDGSVDYHALSKSYLGVTATRQQTRFASDAEFLDINLQTSLNRVDSSYGVYVRHNLTPLTTLVFTGSRAYSTFEFSPLRDSVSTSALASATFSPAALIRGKVSVGYTDFKPVDPALPPYGGLIADIDLTYVLLGSTRFAVSGGRGVQYSYDVNQPYYVQSRIGGSIAQQIFGPLDVQVRADIASLAYRDRAGATIAVPDRTDHVTTIGLGIGYHMGRDLRLSLNVDQNNRDTRVVDHQYDKFLIGSSLTYGF